MLEQQAYDSAVRRPSIPEDHGLHQRGPAELVDVIYVDLRSQQDADRLDVAVMCGGNERRSAIPIGACEIGTCGERQLEDLVPAFGARVKERRILDGILRIDIRPGPDEGVRDVNVIEVRRQEKCRPSLRIATVDVSACAQGCLQFGKVAARRGSQEPIIRGLSQSERDKGQELETEQKPSHHDGSLSV
jgi:hypothetical protein